METAQESIISCRQAGHSLISEVGEVFLPVRWDLLDDVLSLHPALAVHAIRRQA